MKYIQLVFLSLFISSSMVGQEWNVTSSGFTMYTDKGVNIGAAGGSTLHVRHIDGKDYQSWADDDLFLNWGTGDAVHIGRFNNNTPSNLFVSGNVGIGITSPKNPLSIGYNAGNTQLGFQRADTAENFQIGVNEFNGAIFSNLSDGGDFDFQSNVGGGGMESVFFVEGSNGNIGIGTNTPNAKLNIVNSETIGLSNLSKSSILLGSAESGLGLDSNEIIAKGVDLYLGTTTEDRGIYFKAGGTTNRMTINGTTGFVGIGTTAPAAGLEVKKDSGIKVSSETFGSSFGGVIKMADGFQNTTWRDDMLFSTSGGFMFKMDQDGNGISNGGSEVVGFNIYNQSNESVFAVNRSTNSVGIGTASPTEKLTVNGNIEIGFNQFLKGNREDGNKSNLIGYESTGTNILAISENSSIPSEVRIYAPIDLNQGVSIFGIDKSIAFFRNDGNVGIGTTSPASKLEVSEGDIRLKGYNTSRYIRFAETENNQGSYINYDGTNNTLNIGVHETNDNNLESDINAISIVRSTANVGIGTTEVPENVKLGVNGRIAATEVKVALMSNWPDFVFENEYELPALKEVENQIAEKGHLKDIPSAKEVAENGILLGDMNAKLLQKIEELTLYTIAQEKKIEQFETYKSTQNKKMELLIKRLEQLETK